MPTFSREIEDGAYTFAAPSGCLVRATDGNLQSKIWFKTPALDEVSIDELESIQLFTRSRFQRKEDEPVGPEIEPGQSFSWFDIIVLEHPDATGPKVVNGVSMVWLSHANVLNDYGPVAKDGQLFDENDVEPDDDESELSEDNTNVEENVAQPNAEDMPHPSTDDHDVEPGVGDKANDANCDAEETADVVDVENPVLDDDIPEAVAAWIARAAEIKQIKNALEVRPPTFSCVM